MVDINRLKAFIQAAETLSFSDTGKRLHVSQPTVSKYISDLEREFGVPLFDRSENKLRLTEVGQTLLPWARKLVKQSYGLEEMAKSLQGKVAGHLKIACTTAAGKYILPRLAARFRQQHPQVNISILACTQVDVIATLLKEEADMGVVSFEAGGSGLDCQYFLTDHIILIVPSNHPWATRQFIEPEELIGEALLMREPTSGTRRTLLSELAIHDISLDDLNVLLEIGNAEAIVAAVGAGLGVAFVSRLAAAYALAFECVIEVPVKSLDLRRKICIARPTLAVTNRPQEVFWNFIHDPINKDLYRLAEF